MRRRRFCKGALAAGVAAAIPGCGRNSGRSATTGAITGAGDEITIEQAAISELADSLTGTLYLPADDGYDAVRKVWNGMIDKRPAMILQCQSVEDVANAVTFAGERNLLVAVKCGGHSFPGKSTCNGGMMIDLSPMHSVDVDVDARTARVDGGALLGHVDSATLEHGLLTTTGIVAHTGVGGFALGGGLGRTDRMHCLAVDNLRGATVVTADGRLLAASSEENEDLFWAIRGGGGNFGVVTEFIFDLHPFDSTVYAGDLIYPFSKARDLLHLYADIGDSLPNELNLEPYMFVNPDGDRMIGAEICYAGDHGNAESVLKPLLDFATPAMGELGPMPYSHLQTKSDDMYGHGKQYYLKSGFVVELTDSMIDAMVGSFEGDDLPAVWFQHLGGASNGVAADATAYPHRDVRYNVGVMRTWEGPDESTEAGIAEVRRIYSELAPHMKGFYTNLNDDTEKKTWGNYGENYPRLVEIKNRYDPSNLFRLNANIQPTV